MALFNDTDRRLRAQHRANREALALTSVGWDKEETDDYLEANNRVIESEKTLPWWKRLDIDYTVG